MEHLLHIGITADVLPGPIRISADGCLTEDTVEDLLPMLKHGAALNGCSDLVVDLGQADHIEAAALDVVEVFTSGHNAAGEAPVINVQLPRPRSTPNGRPLPRGIVGSSERLSSQQKRASSDGQVCSAGHSPMLRAPSVVSDLMVPLGVRIIGITQSLREAAERLGDGEEALVVVGLHNTAIGFISSRDLEAIALTEPDSWQRKRCAALVQLCETRLRPTHTIDAVIHLYRHGGIRSLLVFDGETPIGLLQPAAVRRWCQEHGPLPLEDLMYEPDLNLTVSPEHAQTQRVGA